MNNLYPKAWMPRVFPAAESSNGQLHAPFIHVHPLVEKLTCCTKPIAVGNWLSIATLIISWHLSQATTILSFSYSVTCSQESFIVSQCVGPVLSLNFSTYIELSEHHGHVETLHRTRLELETGRFISHFIGCSASLRKQCRDHIPSSSLHISHKRTVRTQPKKALAEHVM